MFHICILSHASFHVRMSSSYFLVVDNKIQPSVKKLAGGKTVGFICLFLSLDLIFHPQLNDYSTIFFQSKIPYKRQISPNLTHPSQKLSNLPIIEMSI